MNIKKTWSLLYIIGQSIELMGGFLIFKYGIETHSPSLGNNDMGKIVSWANDMNANRLNRRRSKFGFILIVIGVFLQTPLAICNYTES
jgi:hypothetical protein